MKEINLFYSVRKYKAVNFSFCIQGSSGSENNQQQMVGENVGSIPPCARDLLYFFMQYHGKIPEVLKTAGAKHVFTPLSDGKYFPVVDRCRLASSFVCTGISPSVL